MSKQTIIYTACLVAALLLALLCATTTVVEAGHRCHNNDCSDIVGEALVKDNLGTGAHFNDRHHDELQEHQRINRIKLSRRGQL